jgi:hypothetical protein
VFLRAPQREESRHQRQGEQAEGRALAHAVLRQ